MINCLLVSAVGTAGEITDSSVIEILEDSHLSELPQWSESFELAEIRNSSLHDFLKEKIIPYFDRAGGKEKTDYIWNLTAIMMITEKR